MNYLATIRKALMATAFTAAGTIGIAMLDGNLTTRETIASAGAALIAGAAVWRIPNQPGASGRGLDSPAEL